MLSALALCVLSLPQSQEPEGWRALPFPRLCQEAAAEVAFPGLWNGRHIELPGDLQVPARYTAPGYLPLAALVGLLAEEGARTRTGLYIEPGGPPLLARGTAEALDRAQGLCAELDAQGRGFEVEVTAWLLPGASGANTHPARAAFLKATEGREPLGRARLRSGASTALGVRGGRDFLAGYEVQVATGAAVAGPRLGRVHEGRTLHLRVQRARQGETFVLEGLLDLCELESLEDFDPDTRDLGLVQLPHLAVAQVAFAGAVERGGVLALEITGAPLAEPDWTLWIEANGSPVAPGRWRARDLALLEGPVLDLPMPSPGGALERGEGARGGRTLLASVSAATVAQAADQAHTAGGRSPIVWSNGLVLAPTGEAALWGEVDALVSSVEAEHLRAGTLRVRHGGLAVTLPALEGRPVRVLVGRESAHLAGYDLQVAQDTWMPQPVVEPVFDGLCVQGHLEQGRLVGEAWRSHPGAQRLLERAQAALARLPLASRALERSPFALEFGTPVVPPTLPASEGRPALELIATPGP